jgi:hypothetical protein
MREVSDSYLPISLRYPHIPLWAFLCREGVISGRITPGTALDEKIETKKYANTVPDRLVA